MPTVLDTREDAYRLLAKLGAPPHLVRHHQLVGEAAAELVAAYAKLGIACDIKRIELGAALHDTGKIEHLNEMYESGSCHESAGEALLLTHGVAPEIARCCVTHASWSNADVSFEERSVALADKLWKGKRVAELELLVVDHAAKISKRQRWDVFAQLDTVFERIASKGDERLRRSQIG